MQSGCSQPYYQILTVYPERSASIKVTSIAERIQVIVAVILTIAQSKSGLGSAFLPFL
jgi:hypothetical protein